VDWGYAVRLRPYARGGHPAFLNPGELRDLLGRRTIRDIRDAGRSVGFRGALRGHWVHGRHETVLVVTMGGSDAAEFVDFNRDGFVDEAWVVSPRGYRPVTLGW
jgi:hypothetical protein